MLATSIQVVRGCLLHIYVEILKQNLQVQVNKRN